MIAIRIATLFRNGAEAQAKAAALTKSNFTRSKAKDALLPAFASAYKAETVKDEESGTIRWALSKGRGSKSTQAAKMALNRLLRLAFEGKKSSKPLSAADRIHQLAKALARLTPAQVDRVVAEAKKLRNK